MGGDPTVIARDERPPEPVRPRETTSHVRSVLTFLVLFYLLTVPPALYLIWLISPSAARELGELVHLILIPLAVAEAWAHGAVARGERPR
jgi:hypothetical protein